MNNIGHYPNGKAIWRCDHCGSVGPWVDSWGWYGSYRDADNGTMPAIWCSAECCNALTAEGITKPRWKAREAHWRASLP